MSVLIPIPKIDGIVLELSEEMRLISAEALWRNIVKSSEEFKKSGLILDTLNDNTPFEIRNKNFDRYIKAVNSYADARDALFRLKLTQQELDNIVLKVKLDEEKKQAELEEQRKAKRNKK